MSDIEAGLGLKRKHLIAISLLVGNDHDMNGVRGIGLDNALHFVKAFNEDDILNRYGSFRGINILLYHLKYLNVMEYPLETRTNCMNFYFNFCLIVLLPLLVWTTQPWYLKFVF